MLDLKSLFRAVIIPREEILRENKKRIMMIIMFISLIFTPIVAFAQTEGQTLVREYGLSVKWIEPKMNYKSIYIRYLFSEGLGEGLGVIQVTLDDNTSKHGIVDETGEMVTPVIYDEIGWFSEGLCYVRLGSKKIFIDKTGKEILNVSDYDHVKHNFRNGFTQTELNGKVGLINKSGDEILPCNYDEVFNNESGLVWARKDGLYGFFDSSGKEISGMIYSDIKLYGINGFRSERIYDFEKLIVVKKDGKFGVVNNQAAVVIPPVYINALVCDNEIIALNENGKWIYVNVKGENITPFKFDYPGSFSENLAAVFTNEKYGYVNKQGEMVIPYQYDFASDFYKGMASVTEIIDGENHYYIIDKTGKKLAEHKDYLVKRWGDALIAQHEPAGGLIEWFGAPSYMEAILDGEGNRLTDFSYTNISEFEEGVAVAVRYGTSLCGMINRYGEEIVPFIFDSIEMINKDSCIVKIRDYNGSNGRLGILTLPADAATRKPSFERPITVYLDGLDLYFDVEPKIVNDRTMVPMRKIFEVLGSDVSWDNELRKVTAIKGNTKIELSLGSNAVFINGEAITLDAPPIIENNRTLVPLRFFSEALDCDVKWDADIRRVSITSGNMPL